MKCCNCSYGVLLKVTASIVWKMDKNHGKRGIATASGLPPETDHPMIPQNYPPWKTKMEAENKTALLKGTSSEPNLHFWVLAVKFWECTWKIPSNSKLPTLPTNQTLIELFCMKK